MQKNISMKFIILFMAALMLPFFFINMAVANCYSDGPSNRLSNYCAIKLINGKRVDAQSLRLVDYKLKIEGNSNGLGLPVEFEKSTTQRYLNPLLYYSNNINGGNSSKPLELGNLIFAGDEEYFSKSGMLAGMGAGLSGRYIYGEGRYLQYSANGGYAYSPEHKKGVVTANARVCNIRHIQNWWYLDICAVQSRIRRDITDTTNSDLSFVASKVINRSEQSFNQIDFGLKRHFSENYEQNQLIMGIDTIHSNGIFTKLSATVGEAITSQLATKISLDGKLITAFANKPITLAANYTVSDGGIMLGVIRDERNYGISLSYPIWKKLDLSIGYQVTDSTIDYFDLSSPTLGLQLPIIQF
jgi:hypothetical protein